MKRSVESPDQDRVRPSLKVMGPPSKRSRPPPLDNPDEVWSSMLASFSTSSTPSLELVDIVLSGTELEAETDNEEWQDLNQIEVLVVEEKLSTKHLEKMQSRELSKTYGGDRSIKLDGDDADEVDYDVDLRLDEAPSASTSIHALKSLARVSDGSSIHYWRSLLDRVEGQLELALAHLDDGKLVSAMVPDLCKLLDSDVSPAISWLTAANICWHGDRTLVPDATVDRVDAVLSQPLDIATVKILRFYRSHLVNVVKLVDETNPKKKFIRS